MYLFYIRTKNPVSLIQTCNMYISFETNLANYLHLKLIVTDGRTDTALIII